ncbi:prepilin [Thermus scotoductus]|uniref:Prepilin n=1 Tax=Thermus scotoductus TaxID=37636 RepID=A0A430UYZ3_THESC|nr:prepilin-type N-terminal cleavage/methylation domain-containing protein [Thermus scotoductus]RTH99025.1 prepilin [Thermus scotoductus]RTI14783.1 prepilin [Thermus scotoductus]
MRPRGFTLVELLVAIALLALIFAVALRYFTLQAEQTRRIQARSEVQDRVRLVMEVVSQDLLLAGNQYYIPSSGSVSQKINVPSPYLSATDGGYKDTFRVRYVTSLRREVSSACREVSYSFQDNTLRREDKSCGGSSNPQPLADGILALDITYICSNFDQSTGTFLTAKSGSPPCPAGSYTRSARVRVVGRSLTRVSGSTFSDPAFASECKDYFCFALEQEVLLPNLKDQ